jgi:SET domain-containing protein
MRRIVVRRSPNHGRRVFALTNIQSGQLLVEYQGEVTSWRVTSQRYQRDSAEDGHTFFVGLDDGHVNDGVCNHSSSKHHSDITLQGGRFISEPHPKEFT